MTTNKQPTKQSPEEQLLNNIIDGFEDLYLKLLSREITKRLTDKADNSKKDNAKEDDVLDSIIQFFVDEISKKYDLVEKVNE